MKASLSKSTHATSDAEQETEVSIIDITLGVLDAAEAPTALDAMALAVQLVLPSIFPAVFEKWQSNEVLGLRFILRAELTTIPIIPVYIVQ